VSIFIFALLFLIFGTLCIWRFKRLIKNRQLETEWKNLGVAMYMVAVIALALGTLMHYKF